MSDYKVIWTTVLSTLNEVRLYDETLTHISEQHPEVPILLPMVQYAIENAIVRPTHVERSHSESYVFVDSESRNRSGDPLRVPVKVIGANSGRVRTAYFASTSEVTTSFGGAAMSEVGPFSLAYDRGSDILYLNVRREPAARGTEDERGIVWRYGEDGSVIGMTLLDFRNLWLSRRSLLVDEISSHFRVSFRQATEAVDMAAGKAA